MTADQVMVYVEARIAFGDRPNARIRTERLDRRAYLVHVEEEVLPVLEWVRTDVEYAGVGGMSGRSHWSDPDWSPVHGPPRIAYARWTIDAFALARFGRDVARDTAREARRRHGQQVDP